MLIAQSGINSQVPVLNIWTAETCNTKRELAVLIEVQIYSV